MTKSNLKTDNHSLTNQNHQAKRKLLIVVDENDKKIGLENKLKCHMGKGILHRAYTIFIFNNNGQLLIQKRSKDKLLWPLSWEASCSSHPYEGENLIESAEKRLKEELGFTCKLKDIGKFQYQAFYKNIGAENEICHLLIGKYNGEIRPNPKEIAKWKWININTLREDIKQSPNKYAPWLEIALEKIK